MGAANRPVVKGSSVRSRRGPATVTGRGFVAADVPLGESSTSREGSGDVPGSQETCPPASQHKPSRKGSVMKRFEAGARGAGLAITAASGSTAQAATATFPLRTCECVSDEAREPGRRQAVRPDRRARSRLRRRRRLLRHHGPDQAVERTSVPAGLADDARAPAEASQFKTELTAVRRLRTPTTELRALSVARPGRGRRHGFFFLKANHQALQVGADLFTAEPGRVQLVAYRTPDGLHRRRGARAHRPDTDRTRVPITVNVRAYYRHPGPARGRDGIAEATRRP